MPQWDGNAVNKTDTQEGIFHTFKLEVISNEMYKRYSIELSSYF